MAVLLTVVTFFSTAAGGLFALRHQDRLHLILGFAAGVMLGVVAFDLLPEIADQSSTVGGDLSDAMARAMIALLAGFLLLHILERTAILHPPHEDNGRAVHPVHPDQPTHPNQPTHADRPTHPDQPYHPVHSDRHHPRRGVLSAAALCAHSLTDGLGIGLAFQAGTGIGLTVAVAVIAHDFADGLNTVTLMMVNRNTTRRSLAMLGVDATAPLIGAASTLLFTIPEGALRLYLGFFAGVLLYLATSDILPEAHARHPGKLTLASTVAGVAVMYAVTRVAL
jgi:ZIP family zinc transporter